MREKSKDPRCSHRNDGGAMHKPVCIYAPHHISTAMNEALTQRAPTTIREPEPKPFTTCLLYSTEKKLFWVCTEQNPHGGLSSGCKSRQSFGESFRERDAGCFSQKTGKQCHITLSPSCGLKVFSYFSCKLVSCLTDFTFVFPDYCFALMNIQIHWCFCQ